MIPRIEGTLPMEVSTLVHEEASGIAHRIAMKARARGLNVILDITMSSVGSVQKKIENFSEKGYEADALFVHIPPETSKERGQYRYHEGLNETLRNGGDGIGGRPLPDHVVDSQRPEVSEMLSKNAENLVQMTAKGLFKNTPRVFDNSGSGPEELNYDKFSRPFIHSPLR